MIIGSRLSHILYSIIYNVSHTIYYTQLIYSNPEMTAAGAEYPAT